MSQKLNGYSKWIAMGLTAGLLAWNAVTTYAIKNNDLVHLAQTVEKLETRNEKCHDEIKAQITIIQQHLLESD